MSEWTADLPLILVIADDRDERDRLRGQLSDAARAESFADPRQAFERLAHGEVDLVVVSSANGMGLGFAERLAREHPAVSFLLLVDPDQIAEGEALLRSDEDDLLPRGAAPVVLRQTVSRRLELGRLRAERRWLRDRVRLEETCRELASCLDAGKAYPVALDLLLGATSRGRGFALFHRPSFVRGDGVAFRGLSEAEACALRSRFVDDKPLELRRFEDVEVVARGEVLDAVHECGLSVDRLLAVPLRGRESEYGVLWLLEDGRGFSPQDLEVARTIALHGSTAVGNAERFEHAKESALVDDVTEAYNARYLMAQTDRELQRAERYGSPLSVLFLDLDRFKLVNDRHGHLVGSDCLRELADLLRQCVREVDTLARYGGDEFTLLLVDTGHDEALAVARRIRRTVEDHAFESAGDASLRLTISIGVGTYPEHGSERATLLDVADQAMYLAKSHGRNRVCSASEVQDAAPAGGPRGS